MEAFLSCRPCSVVVEMATEESENNKRVLVVINAQTSVVFRRHCCGVASMKPFQGQERWHGRIDRTNRSRQSASYNKTIRSISIV